MSMANISRSLCALVLGLGLSACTGPGGRGSGDGFDSNPNPKPSVQTLASMAHVLAAQGKDAETEVVLLRLIDQHPEYMPAYNELCELYMRHDQLERALEILAQGLGKDPADAVLMNNRGMCHLLRGDFPAAASAFEQASGARPDDARFRANLASAQGMDGRFDESLASYLEIVAPSDAHHNVGVLAEAFGDHQRAEVEFAAAERLTNAGRLDQRTRR